MNEKSKKKPKLTPQEEKELRDELVKAFQEAFKRRREQVNKPK